MSAGAPQPAADPARPAEPVRQRPRRSWAGVYPERQASGTEGAAAGRRPLIEGKLDANRVWRRLQARRRDQAAAGEAVPGDDRGPLDEDRVAALFAALAPDWRQATNREIDYRDVVAAVLLLDGAFAARRFPAERVSACALAAVVAAAGGVPVHVVCAADIEAARLRAALEPAFGRLGLDCGCVRSAQNETDRRAAYRRDIVFVTPRELAMDYLRDCVAWPEHVDPAERLVDGLRGGRARSRHTLLRGLGCAIVTDADDTLIDQARAPIVLTRHGHPVYDANALERAFQMARSLEPGRDYEFTAAPEEVALTDTGKRQLREWCADLGRVWEVGPAREFLVAIALVADRLLRRGVHYEVDHAVSWLVRDKLIPGIDHYTRPFLEQAIGYKEDCVASGASTAVARTSYQQFFTRYLHLCGCACSVQGLEKELATIYGPPAVNLAPRRRAWRSCVEAWPALAAGLANLRPPPGAGLTVLLARDEAAARDISERLAALECPHALVDEEHAGAPGALLSAGGLVVWPWTLARRAEPGLSINLAQPPVLIMAQRIDSWRREVRIIAMLCEYFDGPPLVRWWVALDDPVFNDRDSWMLRRLRAWPGLLRAGLLGRPLARRELARLQRVADAKMAMVRKELWRHDASVQHLLAFAGRE